MKKGKSSRPEAAPPGAGAPVPGEAAALASSLAAQFEAVMGSAAQVESDCARLGALIGAPPSPGEVAILLGLVPLLRKRAGEVAAPLFALLEREAPRCPDPWSLLDGMLGARDGELAVRALDLAARLAGSGALPVGRAAWMILAARVEAEDSPLAGPAPLAKVAGILRCGPSIARADGGPGPGSASGPAPAPAPAPAGSDPVLEVYLGDTDPRLRRLAAKALDLGVEPAPRAIARRMLGAESEAFLGPYLDYTRATHLDLLRLAPVPGEAPAAAASLREAEAACGAEVLREAVAALGWARVNLGVEVATIVGVSVGGSLPLMVSPSEAALLDPAEEGRRGPEVHLIRAHGGPPPERAAARGGDDPVARFRAYNLAHAEALADILDVAPLTRAKVERILERMDRIVRDYVALFSEWSDECAILPGIYGELRERVVTELEKEGESPQFSAELTRLVQMFEEPGSAGAVRTLHGLKRYLHQRGLKLGFRLVEAGRATNRTVDLVLVSRRRVLRSLQGIRYADFEPAEDPEADARGARIPYPVAVVAEGFGRQLLQGQEKFPEVKIFCYGNEVHYYLAFGSHPAFLRIDYAPPLQGGMIDLEYYGVSKFELSLHPNLSLDFIRLFFRRLEFDVSIDNTHVHARYDKERALDLGDLCAKVEALFRLAPYLMEVDWTIGYLALEPEARLKVAEAWADSFARWGVLPIAALLTKDRQAILAGVEAGPAGEKEIPWTGQGPYRDRFSAPPPAGLPGRLRAALGSLGLETSQFPEAEAPRPFGQLELERMFLGPIREAVARRELEAAPGGFRRRAAALFEREHECELFARILASEDGAIARSGALARLVAPLERSLRFRTTGTVNGHEVQRARLALRGEAIGLYVLRDPRGIAALALFSREEVLCRRREDPAGAWTSSASADAAALAADLRRSNYATPGTEAPREEAGGTAPPRCARRSGGRTRRRGRARSRARGSWTGCGPRRAAPWAAPCSAPRGGRPPSSTAAFSSPPSSARRTTPGSTTPRGSSRRAAAC